MRTLGTPPASVVSTDGTIQYGCYRGSLPPVDLRPIGKSLPYRVLHHKKWVYLAIASEDLFVGLAVVDLGYATNAFGFAYDRVANRMLVDRSAIGHPASGKVEDSLLSGMVGRFAQGRTRIEVLRRGDELDVDASFGPDLSVRARLDTRVSHKALAVVGAIPKGVVNATEKHALLPVTGELVAQGARRSLDGAFGGWDYTHGYLARHTSWRWAYLLGRTREGQRVGLNLTQGFLGEIECVVWLDDELHPVGEGRFEFNARDPMSPWRITTSCGAVDLRFTPGGLHAEHKDFKVLRSKFVQPVGCYDGTIKVGKTTATLERVLGVAEDQDVVW